MIIKKFFSTIAFKLIVPIVLLFVIVMTIAFTRKVYDYKKFVKEKSKIEIEALITAINNKTEAALNSAIVTSAMNADFSSVKWAYSVYNQTGDMDSAYAIIDRSISPKINAIKRISGIRPKVQFHLPSSKVLFRTGSDKYGNDESFRQAITEINESQRFIKTLDVDENGLVLTGIVPVFNSKGTYLGSTETSYPFEIIFSRVITNNKKESFAIYIANDKLDKENISSKNNKSGSFYLFKESTNFKQNNINQSDFNFVADKPIQKLTKDCVCSTFPLKNNFGEIIGAVSVQLDVSEDVVLIKEIIIKNIIFAFIIIVLIIISIYLGVRWIVISPIDKLSKDINELAKGKIIEKIENKKSGVIFAIYQAFNAMFDRVKETTEFANQIGKGNLNAEIKNLNEEDELGQALVRMKNNLLEAEKYEKQNKIEADKRVWATKGLADFSEILRRNNKDVKALVENIISNLVRYTNSNQGGFFILKDEDSSDAYLELEAAYAYERNKYTDTRIKLREGLIGTCAIEKETIFITDVPDNYLNITSGLGQSNPRCILVIPLKFEDEIFGVVELASFDIYEDYQIKFIEKLAESIASTLSITKTNVLTAALLEQSQQQTEELAATEEEMRQNLEEMQVTQEQLEKAGHIMKNKNNEMQAQMKAIDKVALVSKTDPKGIITYVNDLFCEIAGYAREELIGENHNIIRHPDMTKAAFRNLWDTIQAGEVWSGKVKNRIKSGGFYWVDANISPVYDENEEIKEYLAIRYLVTHYINDEETVKLVHEVFPDKK